MIQEKLLTNLEYIFAPFNACESEVKAPLLKAFRLMLLVEREVEEAVRQFQLIWRHCAMPPLKKE